MTFHQAGGIESEPSALPLLMIFVGASGYLLARKQQSSQDESGYLLYRRSSMSGVINLKEKLQRFSEYWSPRVVAEMNDYQFKLAKFEGRFVWHRHEDTDEVFLVLSGRMGIELRDETVELGEGEMYVVPRGVEHRPFAKGECHVLLVEPRGVVNTGDADSELEAENDVWV